VMDRADWGGRWRTGIIRDQRARSTARYGVGACRGHRGPRTIRP
jgi:hypothetical protein